MLLIYEDEVDNEDTDNGDGITNENYDLYAAETPTGKKETKLYDSWFKNLDKVLHGQNSKYRGKHTSVIAAYTVLQKKTHKQLRRLLWYQ